MADVEKFDVITIGSATLDVFIESDDANIVSVSSKDKNSDFMSFPYGSKVEITDFSRSIGGGAVNTAINFSNLGFKTSTIIKLGNDEIAPVIKQKIQNFNIDTSNIICSKHGLTGFSIVLVSFQGDRTVLAHRGQNACITADDIDFDKIKNTKWLYVAPLAGESNKLLDKIAKFAKEKNIKLAINAGSTALKKGVQYFSKVIEASDIMVMNKEEATLLTKIEIRPDTKTEFFSSELIHPDLVKIFKNLYGKSSGIVLITDGKNGATAYDGKKFYIAPCFPSCVRSTLGAGDAFASTFVSAMMKYNSIETAIKFASVNSASVVEIFGAQEGLINFNGIEEKLKENKVAQCPFEVKILCD